MSGGSDNNARGHLPKGWTVATLNELGTWTGGGTPSKRNRAFWNGDIPWVSPKDMKAIKLDDAIDHVTARAVDSSAAKLFPANSLALVVRSGILEHTLPIALVRVAATANQDLKVLIPYEGINPEWLLYALLAEAPTIRELCQKDGTTVASIDITRLKAYPLLVPPRPEQDRIVEAVESAVAAVDAGENSIEDAEGRLDLFEASLLHSVFNADADGRGAQWELLTLAELCERVGGTIQTGPFGSQLHKSDYSDTGTPVLMPKDLDYGRISDASVAKVGSEHVARLSRHKLEAGDIVQSRRGDLRRRAVVTEREVGWLCGTGCFLIRLKDPDLAEYVLEHLNEPTTATRLDEQALGVTMPNLNGKILGGLTLRIPPPPERRAVIAAVASARDHVDGLRTELRRPSDSAAALRRSILHHACTGQLVPQDPSDEPASELLDRIKIEKAEREAEFREAKKRARASKKNGGARTSAGAEASAKSTG